MDAKEIQASLVEFVCRNFLVDEGEFAVDRSLIDQGIIDSFGLVEIAAHLRKKYGIETDKGEMTRENFGSIVKMSEYARRKIDG